jgi:hypothetical protein
MASASGHGVACGVIGGGSVEGIGCANFADEPYGAIPMRKYAKIFLWTLLVIYALLLAPAAQAATATLTWDGNAEPDLAGYKIYRSFGACGTQGPTFLLGQVLLGQVAANIKTYVDSSVPDNIAGVIYEVTAIDTGGAESPRSNRVCKAIANLPPAAPTNLRVAGRPSAERVVVAWAGKGDMFHVEAAMETQNWAPVVNTSALTTTLNVPASGRRLFRVCATVGGQRICGREGIWASR